MTQIQLIRKNREQVEVQRFFKLGYSTTQFGLTKNIGSVSFIGFETCSFNFFYTYKRLETIKYKRNRFDKKRLGSGSDWRSTGIEKTFGFNSKTWSLISSKLRVRERFNILLQTSFLRQSQWFQSYV